tara:strand:- start:367 stop:633 length:267 start_codon:yes stop_codon:yes gene_type:complete
MFSHSQRCRIYWSIKGGRTRLPVQRIADSPFNEVCDPVLIPEADLRLCRMNIDIDLNTRKVQVEKEPWASPLREGGSISSLYRSHQCR